MVALLASLAILASTNRCERFAAKYEGSSMNAPVGLYSRRMHCGVITVKRAGPTTTCAADDGSAPAQRAPIAKTIRTVVTKPNPRFVCIISPFHIRRLRFLRVPDRCNLLSGRAHVY